ncbi:hypothetical protein DWW25_21415, partial [Bacteroides xylanisolvens]
VITLKKATNSYPQEIAGEPLSLFNHQIILSQSEILEIRFRAAPPLKIDSFLFQKGMKQILL